MADRASVDEPANKPLDSQVPSLIRVRYAETDQMGYVYHGNFFMYFEVARGDMARATGVAYTAYEAHGAAMPLLECGVVFRRPARYDDLLAVCAKIARLTPVRARIEYAVYRLAERTATFLASGFTEHVFTDHTGRPTRANRIVPVWESLQQLAAVPVFPDLIALDLADMIQE